MDHIITLRQRDRITIVDASTFTEPKAKDLLSPDDNVDSGTNDQTKIELFSIRMSIVSLVPWDCISVKSFMRPACSIFVRTIFTTPSPQPPCWT